MGKESVYAQAMDRRSRSGAEEGTRTPTPLRVHGPEPCASANSATSARVETSETLNSLFRKQDYSTGALAKLAIALRCSSFALRQEKSCDVSEMRRADLQLAASAASLELCAPYSFSLLCSVFRLMPRISAARVLLLLVASRVFKMSSRSASSTVVPTPRRTALASCTGARGTTCPKPGGKCLGSTRMPSHTITARSNVLRNSRTFPGQAYERKACITGSVMPATVRLCFWFMSASSACTRSGTSSLCSRRGGKLILNTFKR